jgi:predicted nucleic acid-binding protein
LRITFDTNLLVYAADSAAGERHSAAASLLRRAFQVDALLVLQSLAEFVDAVTRKRKLEWEVALRFVDAWRAALPVVGADPDTFDAATRATRLHGIPFWDAMLWAVADAAECDVLLSEDFQDGRRLGRVQFVNPFDPANRRLVDTILPPA